MRIAYLGTYLRTYSRQNIYLLLPESFKNFNTLK